LGFIGFYFGTIKFFPKCFLSEGDPEPKMGVPLTTQKVSLDPTVVSMVPHITPVFGSGFPSKFKNKFSP